MLGIDLRCLKPQMEGIEMITEIVLKDCEASTLYHACNQKDREDIWRIFVHAIDQMWQYQYCKDIKDRSEIWKALGQNCIHPTESQYNYMYCRYVRDREDVWKALTCTHINPYWQYMYCREVRYEPKIANAIGNSTCQGVDRSLQMQINLDLEQICSRRSNAGE